jgi:hypothetical protein
VRSRLDGQWVLITRVFTITIPKWMKYSEN